MSCEPRDAIGELAVAPERPPAVQQRRSIRMDARRAHQKLSEIQAIAPGRSVGNAIVLVAPRASHSGSGFRDVGKGVRPVVAPVAACYLA